MIRKILGAVVGLVLMVNLCGCALFLAGAVGGAGTAYWLSGKLSEEVNASYDRTVYAAKKALASLGMKISRETKTEEVTQLRSKYSDGSEVWVDLRPLTANSSKVEIRVGAKGSKERATKILERIKKYL